MLVNPLQAKHIPITPSVSLKMMETLGKQIADNYPNTKLVIGFAETGTAIGAMVADCLDDECIYIHTTREPFEKANYIEFQEEHSHAVEQLLCSDNLEKFINETDVILFIDDELSTGKTLLNIVNLLRGKCPNIREKQIVVASIINRLSDQNMLRLYDADIQCECLLKLDEENYEEKISSIVVELSLDFILNDFCEVEYKTVKNPTIFPNPRFGVNMADYKASCVDIFDSLIKTFSDELKPTDNVVVIGTEEFMYPALIFGKMLEEKVNSVKCHSTTRSPIEIASTKEYPIYCGFKIPSFYDGSRTTYIYNIEQYDKVFVVSDTRVKNTLGMEKLSAVLKSKGNEKIYYIQGEV